jgi:mannose-6-phosphate isomerase
MNLPPLQFEPIFQQYLWGGRRLAEWFPSAPSEGPIAEAWLVSDEIKNPSRVAGGPYAGRTLRQMMDEFGPQLLGHQYRPGQRFPLLLKLLDAREPLSVQVHPNDDHAGPGSWGKTEAWVVLHAEPGARIYAGLKQGVDEAALRRAIDAKRVEDVLHSFEAKTGDCVFIPAGTVHAIGAGLLIFEVQQTSDVTYRLHDWGRVDARTGQPRELHIERSIACIDWKRGPVSPVVPNGDLLVDCPYFRLWREDMGNLYPGSEPHEFRIWVFVEGEGLLRDRIAGKRVFRPGTSWLIPPGYDAGDSHVEGSYTIFECAPPAEAPL